MEAFLKHPSRTAKILVWNGHPSILVHLVSVCLGVLLICSPAHSQGNAGRILGAVVDQSGGAIAGANVTIMDVQRGIPRTLMTDEVGEYSAPNLLPGSCDILPSVNGGASQATHSVSSIVGA
jgi:hypothetical protein